MTQRRDARLTLTFRLALACLVGALLVSWAMPHSALAGTWKGTEETVDGVLHVKNPGTPVEKASTIELEEQWRLGGWDDDENIFGVIMGVEEDDDGTLYMLDGQLLEIRVYDKDGKFLRAIGRRGEGPGEFQNAAAMFRLPGGNLGVLQAFPGKIVTLTPDGDPGPEFPLPEHEGEGFKLLQGARYAGKNLAITYFLSQPSKGSWTMNSRLALIDPATQTESLLHQENSSMDFADPKITEEEFDTFRNRWAGFLDGRAASVLDNMEYEITVWGADGNLDRVIEVDYPTHVRTDADTKELLELYEGFSAQAKAQFPNIKFAVGENHTPVIGGGLYPRTDGSLWVLNSRGSYGTDEGVLGIFDVFDAKGRFVHQITLKGQGKPRVDGYFFAGDRLFVVTDFINAVQMLQAGGSGAAAEEEAEEAEPMQVICYKLDGPTLGMK